MRSVLCGFALGVVMLQHQAGLPERVAWAAGALIVALALVLAMMLSMSTLRGRHAPRWRLRLGTVALTVAATITGFGYAAWRAELRLDDALPPSWEGRDIDVTGYVRGLPARDTEGTRFLFAVDVDEVLRVTGIDHFPRLLQLSWIDRTGRGSLALVPGERWRLTVRLKRPHGNANFGGHDAEASLLARGVRATGYVTRTAAAHRLLGTAGGVRAMIDRSRLALRARIDAALADAPHRGIVTALAIGAQDGIGPVDRLLLRRTGTSHLVAISGLHIGLVAGLGAALAAWLWRRSGFLGARLAANGAREWPLVVPTPIVAAAAGTLSAACYAALAGFNVPAQRALWMLAGASLAFASGRRVAPSLVLAWAVALVLLIDPWAAITPGFWLSFGAVAVISFAAHAGLRVRTGEPGSDAHQSLADCDILGQMPPATWRDRLRQSMAKVKVRLASALRVQWAVTLGLAPLTALLFSQISLVGPLANALAIPWVSALVTPIVLVGIALPAPLDAMAFQAAHALIDPLMRGLQLLAMSEWAEWHPVRPGIGALVSALVGVLWWFAPRGWPLRFAAPLTWLPLVMPPPDAPEAGTFRLTALDVGQGSAVLIETMRHALLFDAGPGPESTRAGERIVAPYLQANGVPSLDALVVSHGDADHAGGAPAVLDAIPVRQLLGGLPPANGLWRAAEEQRIDALRCATGQRWQWDGVEFTVLWPDAGPLPAKPNAQSCVLKVSGAGFSALLTGDIDASVERTLHRRASAARLEADVLVVAHHGSKTSSTEPFLDSVDPRVAVFQVGYRNRFHHPHPSVWSRFTARDIALARTDLEGAARIELDGDVLTLERYRDTHRRYWMD